MVALESDIEGQIPITLKPSYSILLGPIHFEGRETEEVEYDVSPLDLYKAPIIDDIEYKTLRRPGRHFVNLLNALPEGMGILRRSASRAIYPDFEESRALNNLHSLQNQLNGILEPKYEIYNPVSPGHFQVPEARFSLRRVGELAKTDQEQAIDWEELSKKFATQDVQAFESVYEKTKDQLFRYLFYKTESADLAEEMMNQIYATAWDKAPNFRWQQLPIQHWIMTIARNNVSDHWRKQKVQSRHFLPSGFFEHENALNRSAKSDLDKDLEMGYAVDLLGRNLKKLPDEYRDVLILRFVDNLHHKEVAAILGKSEEAVRQIQYRGLRMMKTLMGASGYTPSD